MSGSCTLRSTTGEAHPDLDFARDCLAGRQEALLRLSIVCRDFLRNFLRQQGASDDEAEEISSEVFCECVAGKTGRGSLLHQYGAESTLNAWLARVALNRYIDHKRRLSARLRTSQVSAETVEQHSDRCDPAFEDQSQLKAVRKAVRRALAICPPETMVMLQLAYCQRVTQRDIGLAWGWSEFRVSRFLRDARNSILQAAIRDLRLYDSSLEISFELILRAFRVSESDSNIASSEG